MTRRTARRQAQELPQTSTRGGVGRVPSRARRAVRALEAAYAHGTDEAYAQALGQLEREAAGLKDVDRDALNMLLAEAHERLERAERVAALAAALAGPWETVDRLPGNVELVRLVAGGEKVMATVPAASEGDSAHTKALVERAREALRAGRCPRCRAGLAASFEGQAVLEHRPSCQLSERSIERSRLS